MRLVACLLAGLFIATVVPTFTLAADECANARTGAAPSCIDTQSVPAPAPKRYYVYLDWVECPMNPPCQGTPTAHVIGVVWEESNDIGGLQRYAGSPPGSRSDTAILW